MKLKIARRVTAFLLSAVLAVTSVAPCFTTAYATNDIASSISSSSEISDGSLIYKQDQTSTSSSSAVGEEATREVSFEALELKDPESNEFTANIGDSVTLNTELNRDDVLVQYQWQKLYQPTGVKSNQQLFDYAEDSPTWYSFPVSDMTEAQAVEENNNNE